MNSLISIVAIVGLLLFVGTVLGGIERGGFKLRWLLIAAALLALNDFMLVRGYGLFPSILPHANWNWQGKALALVSTLIVASSPAFGWRRVGFTVSQRGEGQVAIASVVTVVLVLLVILALILPNEPLDPETAAFQMTLPGLEEEAFYSGILLYALNQAFPARVHFLGIEWGWGVLLTAGLFGLAHAFRFSGGAFHFDGAAMLWTAGPATIAYWLRLRTGSILLPVVLHNFGNSIGLLL